MTTLAQMLARRIAGPAPAPAADQGTDIEVSPTRSAMWLQQFLYNQTAYPLVHTTYGQQGELEEPPAGYQGLGLEAFAANPVVFAAVMTRLAVFSQVRLSWRRLTGTRIASQFTSKALAIFEEPWPNGSMSDLLGTMLLRADLGGNAYVWRDESANRLHVWRPDYVKILLGSRMHADNPSLAPDATVLGYIYDPPWDRKPMFFAQQEVAHFAPTPDPFASFRGMSWLTPVIREVMADTKATEHKFRYFENAATPNLAIKFDASVTPDEAKVFKQMIEEEHEGVWNAYKTLYVGGGADVTPVGSDLKSMDFSSTQGKGETRILMAAGVHPVIAGASEGLAGSALNAGNYTTARRNFSDIRLQHLWTSAVAALQTITPVPPGAHLWFDPASVPFLAEDTKDVAEVQSRKASSIRTFIDAGFKPDSAVRAIVLDDMSVLEHTGALPVQVQADPNADTDDGDDEGDDDENALPAIE